MVDFNQRANALLGGNPVEDIEDDSIDFDGRAEAALSGNTAVGARVPSQDISTITGKPTEEYDLKAPKPADISTFMKTNLVKGIDAKNKIFAESRGIPLKRYGVQDGESVFVDDAGILRSENKLAPLTTKAIVMGTDPVTIGGTIGSFFGLPGTVIGTTTGETLRQAIAGIVFEDKQTVAGNLIRLGSENLMAVTGDMVGTGLNKSANRVLAIGKPEARTLGKVLKTDSVNFDEARRLKTLGNKFGIDLNIGDTTQSKRIEAQISLLRNLPQTTEVVKAQDILKNRQVQDAVPAFFTKYLTPTSSPEAINKEVREAAVKTIKRLKGERSAATLPFYTKAFAESKPIDVRPVIDFIDAELVGTPARGIIRNSLLSSRKKLLSPDLKKGIPRLLGPDGKPIQLHGGELRTSLKSLDGLKKELGIMINREASKAPNAKHDDVVNNLKNIRTKLIEVMDEGSGGLYADARAVHAFMSPRVNRVLDGLEGSISKLSDKDLGNIGSMLLSRKNTTPDMAADIMKELEKTNPAIREKVVRNFLEFKFSSIKEPDEVVNLGGKIAGDFLGSQQQRAIMKSVLGDKYQNLVDFTEVLKRSGITTGSQSDALAVREAEEYYTGGILRKVGRATTRPLLTKRKVMLDEAEKLLKSRKSGGLAEILMSDSSLAQLQALKKLSPNSEKFTTGLAVFLGLQLGDTIEAKTRQGLQPNILPRR